MMTVGTHEAKTHLTRLIRRVEEGQSVVITRHGKPVAKIVPVVGPEPAGRSGREIVAGFRKLRASVKAAGPSIRALIHQGRRH